jgi:hypothetical protein
MTVDPIFPEFSKELSIPLRATEESDKENAGAIDGKQGTDTVELGGEDLEDNQRKGELGESCPNISPFEGTLGSADLDNLVGSEDGRSGTVHAEVVSVCGTTLGWVYG